MHKHIWIINQYAGSPLHGKEYRSPSIARELVQKGYNVTIIAASHSHHFKTAPEIEGRYTLKTIDGVNFLWVKTKHYTSSKSYQRLLSMFEFLLKTFFIPHHDIGKPDYIIVSSPSPLPILNGLFFKKKYAAKLLFEVRDLWPLSVIELGSMSPKHPFIRFLSYIEKTAYSKSDAVISLLGNALPYMKSQGLEEKKFIFLPNGIDRKLLNNSKKAPEKIIEQINNGKFTIGYAGALGIANDLYLLLDAAKKIENYSDIQIVLMGGGSEEEKLKQYAFTHKINNVIFPGSVKREEVHSILSLFDVCYLGLQKSPLFYHGVSPTKLYDYMAVAKPILYAIDSGNHPVKDAKCGIEVNSGSVDDIVEAILTLFQMDEKEREELGKNGYKTLMKHYTFDKLTNRLINQMEAL